jgi:hypothetical protein
MKSIQDPCLQNAKLWHLIRQLEITNPGKKIVLTPEQRYNLCLYMNGKPYDKKVLAPFIK